MTYLPGDACRRCNGVGSVDEYGVYEPCSACAHSGLWDPQLRECEICGREAQAMGSEARCAEHDSERMER